jgi:hypothetical protein
MVFWSKYTGPRALKVYELDENGTNVYAVDVMYSLNL